MTNRSCFHLRKPCWVNCGELQYTFSFWWGRGCHSECTQLFCVFTPDLVLHLQTGDIDFPLTALKKKKDRKKKRDKKVDADSLRFVYLLVCFDWSVDAEASVPFNVIIKFMNSWTCHVWTLFLVSSVAVTCLFIICGVLKNARNRSFLFSFFFLPLSLYRLACCSRVLSIV